MKRVMVVEWPDGLLPHGPQWERIVTQVNAARPDLLVTNEMPFGGWLPVASSYKPEAAATWIALHELGVIALSNLNVGSVISSRPVQFAGRLANEGYSIVNGQYTAHHHKHLFPEEEGWYEATWFSNGMHGFYVHEICGIKVGFQLCTELMFNELSRKMGISGAELIVTPRATGMRTDNWLFAVQMAAFVGGCYVASSNRSGSEGTGRPQFGGFGFVVAPGGSLQCSTDINEQMSITDVDILKSRSFKSEYPCYVKDLVPSDLVRVH